MPTVLIVDDQPMIRMALRGILESAADLQVIGEADRGTTALAVMRDRLPDVVLLDLRMPEMDGVQTIQAIRQDPHLAGSRILVLTTFETDDYVLAALRAGANGFLGKGAEPQELIEAVRRTARGDALLSPAATRSVIDYVATQTTAPAPPTQTTDTRLDELTSREREIVRLVAHGKTNIDIAEELAISTFTVKTHVNRAMTKLGVSDRAQLVVIAYESGLTES